MGRVMARPVRKVEVLGAEAVFDQRCDGATYVRSPRPLGHYQDKLTGHLEHWAARTGDGCS
jgi:hypothetical protein